MKTRIGVIFGGESVEHEVSIISAVQAMNKIDLEKADTLIRNRSFKNKMDLYKLLNANNLDLMIADYFIFYKKALGV